MGDVQRQEDPLDRHEPDMLVVDSAHERLVTDIVRNLVKQPDRDDRLGLSLLTLASADAAADAVLERHPNVGPSRWTGVDRLLENLRAVFKHDYGGWTPKMGKNRVMVPVQAVTYPNAGGSGGPEPIAYSRLEAANEIPGQRPDVGKGVRVGLPDTLLLPHGTLTGRYVLAEPAKDQIFEVEKNSSPPYIIGHCSQLASLILRQAPSARLDVRPVLTAAEAAKEDPDLALWDVARSMAGYLNSGCQIINCSWACLTRDGEPPLVLERAVGLLTPTIMIVAAASNHGELIAKKDDPNPRAADEANRKGRLPERFSPAFPAALPNVVAVGALDRDDRAASFNPVVRTDDDLGADELAPWIDVLAPGVDTIGAYFGSESAPRLIDVPVKPKKGEVADKKALQPKPFTGAAKWTGTSFAAATVTAFVAARIRPGTSAQEALKNLLDEDDSPIRRAHD